MVNVAGGQGSDGSPSKRRMWKLPSPTRDIGQIGIKVLFPNGGKTRLS